MHVVIALRFFLCCSKLFGTVGDIAWEASHTLFTSTGECAQAKTDVIRSVNFVQAAEAPGILRCEIKNKRISFYDHVPLYHAASFWNTPIAFICCEWLESRFFVGLWLFWPALLTLRTQCAKTYAFPLQTIRLLKLFYFFVILPASVRMVRADEGQDGRRQSVSLFSCLLCRTDERNIGYENSDKRPMLAACRVSAIDFGALCCVVRWSQFVFFCFVFIVMLCFADVTAS